MNKKIKTLDEMKAIIIDLRKKRKKIVHCHGVFDLLHPGHINYFQTAKSQGDALVVTITADKYVNKGRGRPAYNQGIRAEVVASLECVDYVVINNQSDAVEIIKEFQPDVYAKGSEFDKGNITPALALEKQAVESYGGLMLFIKMYPSEQSPFHSTQLLKLNNRGISDCFRKFKKMSVSAFRRIWIIM